MVMLVEPLDTRNSDNGTKVSLSLGKKTQPAKSVMNGQKSTPDVPKQKKEARRRKPKKGKTEKDIEKKTPYQGPLSGCGMFHCDECNKEWFSANSWANCYQKCNECNAKIYPYRQFPRERGYSSKKDAAPPHPENMCQKCMQLGRKCVNVHIDNVKKEDGELWEREE